MLYIGIDVGKSGGYAILNNEGVPVKVDLFSCWNSIGKTFQEFISVSDAVAAVEAVSAMPGQGLVSTFNFGVNYGGWLSLLEVKSISYILVSPRKWQKSILGHVPKGQTKIKAYDYTRRKYPLLNLKSDKDSGIIDALCLAEYARKEHLGLMSHLGHLNLK